MLSSLLRVFRGHDSLERSPLLASQTGVKPLLQRLAGEQRMAAHARKDDSGLANAEPTMESRILQEDGPPGCDSCGEGDALDQGDETTSLLPIYSTTSLGKLRYPTIRKLHDNF